MNVSVELLSTLKNKLTATEYEDFMWEVKKENNPTLASLLAWLGSASGKALILDLHRRCDEFGFFTFEDVKAALLADGKFGRASITGDGYLYGDSESVRGKTVCGKFRKMTELWDAEQIRVAVYVANTLTNYQDDNGKVVTRTEYFRQENGNPHRCYRLV